MLDKKDRGRDADLEAAPMAYGAAVLKDRIEVCVVGSGRCCAWFSEGNKCSDRPLSFLGWSLSDQ